MYTCVVLCVCILAAGTPQLRRIKYILSYLTVEVFIINVQIFITVK